MKQKLFTLLTLALFFCSGAWATDEVLLTYTVTSSSTHGSDLTAGNGKIKFGANKFEESTKSSSGYAYKMDGDNGTKYALLTVSKAFAVGDKITITGSQSGSKTTGYKFCDDTTPTTTYGTLAVSSSKDEQTNTYTIPLGSGLIGKTTVYIFRNTNSIYLHSVEVTRSPSCTDVAAPTGLSCTAQDKTSLTFGWTAAENASSYDVYLYSDAECTAEVTPTEGKPYNVTTTSATLTGLNASTTYYCKVQSRGDGSTYCAEGGVTSAASGTTDDKDFTVTAVSNNDSWGTAASDAGSLDEGETATITATPAKGYEVKNWAVSGEGASITPSGDSHSLTTTLTMGTANATVTATFGLKDYTVTLDNQSATTAGTTSVTTNYNKNTNLTSSITCPEKTDYVFMGYYTAANGEGKRLIDGSGAWIASIDGYTDASKNWKYDGDVTLYACWMKYANSVDFNVYAYSTLDREGSGTSTSDDFDFIETTYNIKNVLGGTTAIDHSANAPYIGLKFKRSGDYLKFAVEAGKQVTIVFGYVKTTKPKMSIDGGAEEPIDITLKSDNQVVYYAATAADRLFKVKASDDDAMVIKKIFITSSASTIKATVGANGYATFATPYALDLTDANRPAGLKAYKATRDGASLSFVALNQTVPAGTGLLLLGENGPNYDIPVVEAAGAVVTDNVMVGVTAATSMQSKADEYYYFVMKKAATAGDALTFAPLSTTSAVSVPAGKAFVEVPNADLTSSHELTFTFEEASGDVTGIAELSSKKQSNGEYFNLNGQRVDASHKGIVIVNGKKFFNK